MGHFQKFSALLIIFLCIAQFSHAQQDNTAFYDIWQVHPKDSGGLKVECNVLSYMRNNEYFNPVADGYTRFGYQLNPRLAYFINPYVRLSVGLFLMREYGDNKYQFAEPTYNITYQKDSLTFILGNIQSSLAHGFIEPMYDFEKVIKQRLEQGAQFKYKTKRIKLDAYIDWQKYQYDFAPFKEQLLHGNNITYRLGNLGTWLFEVPLQYTLFHRGGQIDTLRSVGALVKWNAMTGIKTTWTNANQEAKVEQVKLEANILGSHNSAPVLGNDYGAGLGYYATASLKTKWLTLMTNYWRGEHWSTPMGGALYESVPQAIFTDKSVRFPERNLLFIRLLKDYSLGYGTTLSCRIEPYCDLKSGTWEYNYGLYVNTTPSIWLYKARKGRNRNRSKDTQ